MISRLQGPVIKISDLEGPSDMHLSKDSPVFCPRRLAGLSLDLVLYWDPGCSAVQCRWRGELKLTLHFFENKTKRRDAVNII